ncbi:MAG: CofH family radical SAM protein [Bacteroidia bacterium]|nr:CofH family radical SAM protein [Bacteroidia bacterium]MCC6768398.1 CofH family radical SAM protein [Bacteroidia bacterium]
MNVVDLLQKALKRDWLTQEEGVFLYRQANTTDLMHLGHQLRLMQKPRWEVTWQIDRNVNTTNVCVANCKFCNFFRIPGHAEAYITSMDEYASKVEEMRRFGADQMLLQGGHHPELGIEFYEELFKNLKAAFPDIKLHALGPPEVAHISKLSGLSHTQTLQRLKLAGLDSLPGAGAEILNDRVRRMISKGKCGGQEWLDVMRAAHQLHITTSATMMFGHVETIEERFEHLVWLRQVQHEKPADAKGFLAFIPWPFQDDGTLLRRIRGVRNKVSAEEYIRMVALSRIMLPNIQNIQASWLTVGEVTAQICLYAGANDFGSIMLEENVVSAAGAPHRFTAAGIQHAIREAGFEPRLRNQQYEYRTLPENLEQQVINY